MTSLNDQIIECMTHILVACKVLAEARETDFDGEYRYIINNNNNNNNNINNNNNECVLCEVKVQAETAGRELNSVITSSVSTTPRL